MREGRGGGLSRFDFQKLADLPPSEKLWNRKTIISTFILLINVYPSSQFFHDDGVLPVDARVEEDTQRHFLPQIHHVLSTCSLPPPRTLGFKSDYHDGGHLGRGKQDAVSSRSNAFEAGFVVIIPVAIHIDGRHIDVGIQRVDDAQDERSHV